MPLSFTERQFVKNMKNLQAFNEKSQFLKVLILLIMFSTFIFVMSEITNSFLVVCFYITARNFQGLIERKSRQLEN